MLRRNSDGSNGHRCCQDWMNVNQKLHKASEGRYRHKEGSMSTVKCGYYVQNAMAIQIAQQHRCAPSVKDLHFHWKFY